MPADSSRSPRRPASSSRSGTGCCRRRAGRTRRGRTRGCRRLRVAVNISALQFRQTDLLETIARGAERRAGSLRNTWSWRSPKSVVMQKASDAIVTLENCAKMGVHISIDDFGTGYSSLSYLKRFPIHTLKIDRSFIRDISEDADDAAIVSAIIAHGAQPAAEGGRRRAWKPKISCGFCVCWEATSTRAIIAAGRSPPWNSSACWGHR